MNSSRYSDRSPGTRLCRLLILFIPLLLLAACSTNHYRKAADRAAYDIIQEAQQSALGGTNAFTIETGTSSLDPDSISPAEVVELRAQTGSRLITLEDALDLAVHNSRTYQTQKETLYLRALDLSDRRHSFRPIPFLGTTPTFDRLSDGTRVGSIDTRGGFSKNLKTGGSISVSILNDLTRYYTGDPRRSAISTLSLNFFQPLLRGFGKYNPAVEALTQAERNVIYAVRSFSYFQNEYAITIASDYFNLLAQKDIVRNRYTNYLSRVQATERLEQRFLGQRERAIDVDQARQAELSARNNYINAVASYENALDSFKLELGLPIGEEIHLDDSALYELQAHGLIDVQLPTDLAYRLAIEKQFPALNAIDQFEDAKRKIKVAANNLKADLNLIADARLQSEGTTDYANFDPDDIAAGVGVELDLPLDRLVQRNDYRATLIAFEAQLRNLTLTLDRLKDSIERGLRTLEQRRQTYEIQQGALQVADRRVAAATQLIEAGRAEVRDLVEAQDAQVAAQNAVTAALVSYQEALMQLMLNIGVLETESPKFWLKNHLAAHVQPEAAAPDAELPPQEVPRPDQVF